MFGDGYDVPGGFGPFFGLPDVGRNAPVLPPTLSEQLESLPSRSESSVCCSLLRRASSLLRFSLAR